jgi:hypothetical protein
MSQVINDFDVRQILEELGIEDVNNGASTGGRWFNTRGEKITSYSPVDGAVIAAVDSATEADYEAVVLKAQEAFLECLHRKEVKSSVNWLKKSANTKPHLEHWFLTKWGNHCRKDWVKFRK